MLTWHQLPSPQLDIVGIVAVLGEGSTSRNAQASALGWHHILPRLLPAPQALLKHEHDKRLPTVPGTVVGAYSGNVKFELNFFCQLLHKDNLGKNQVELVEVEHDYSVNRPSSYRRFRKWLRRRNRKTADDDEEDDESEHRFFKAGEQAYGVKKLGPVVFSSLLGCCVSIGMIVGSIYCDDGFALVATLLLSFTSTVVGAASWWRLDFREDPPKARPQRDRQRTIPDSDVVIYYPRQGAFRIVRCTENVSRLYFRTEVCEYVFRDNCYRVLALVASISLMLGLLCMGSADLDMKLAFAASYIALNMVYWAMSAVNPTGSWGSWEHKYRCTTIPVVMSSSPTGPQSGTSTRFNSSESFQNIPVITQLPLSPLRTGSHIVLNSNDVSKKSSFEVPHSSTRASIVTTDVRHRKVVFDENASVRLGSPIGLNVIDEPSSCVSKTQLHSPTVITASSTEQTSINEKTVSKQPEADLEKQRSRSLRVIDSPKDAVTDWLNDRRLIGKRPSIAPVDNVQNPETFTTALWKAIAVTGSTRWLRQTHIAPNNEVWTTWIEQAGKRAATLVNDRGERVAACMKDDQDRIVLPSWDHQGKLSDLFAKEADKQKRRPPPAPRLSTVVEEKRNQRAKVKGITPSIEFKLRLQARNARLRARQNRAHRIYGTTLHPPFAHPLSIITENTSRHDFVGRRNTLR